MKGWIVPGLAVALLLFTLWALFSTESPQDRAFERGYETGMCTFWVGLDRGLIPEEARQICEDDTLRERILLDVEMLTRRSET